MTFGTHLVCKPPAFIRIYVQFSTFGSFSRVCLIIFTRAGRSLVYLVNRLIFEMETEAFYYYYFFEM